MVNSKFAQFYHLKKCETKPALMLSQISLEFQVLCRLKKRKKCNTYNGNLLRK